MIIVCSSKDMPASAASARASHIVSLIPEADMPDPPANGIKHLRIAVDDVTEPVAGKTAPSEGHVAQLINFVTDWDRETPIVVHCAEGNGRSMAAALTLLSLDRPGDEMLAARWLRRRAAYALPNRLIVTHADKLLGRKGRMLAALDAMGPARPEAAPAPVTRVPVNLELQIQY
jgi:predicted protein tyrosine phosphatase